MELLYINTIQSGIAIDKQMESVFAGLLFGERITVIDYFFKYLAIYCRFEELSDKETVRLYCESIRRIEGGEKVAQEAEQIYKTLVSLKNMRGKNKNQMQLQAQCEKNIKKIREAQNTSYVQYLEMNNLMALPGFVKDKTLVLINHRPGEDEVVETIVQRLFTYFTDSEVIHFFDESVLDEIIKMLDERPAEDAKPETMPEDAEDGKYDGSATFLSRLIELPYLGTLSYSQLMIIRNEFTNAFKPFNESVSKLQKELSATICTGKASVLIGDKIDEVYQPLLPELNEIAEKNIYFQHIRNSLRDKPEKELCLCVTTVEMVIYFYMLKGSLLNNEGDELLDLISRKRDIKSCCFYMYLKTVKEEAVDIES